MPFDTLCLCLTSFNNNGKEVINNCFMIEYRQLITVGATHSEAVNQIFQSNEINPKESKIYCHLFF